MINTHYITLLSISSAIIICIISLVLLTFKRPTLDHKELTFRHNQKKEDMIVIADQGVLLFPCVHCQCFIEVLEKDINCGIFRHGSVNNVIIPPHSNEQECFRLSKLNGAVGCFQPFQITKTNTKSEYRIEKCGFNT